jgi:hypothetical protein
MACYEEEPQHNINYARYKKVRAQSCVPSPKVGCCREEIKFSALENGGGVVSSANYC